MDKCAGADTPSRASVPRTIIFDGETLVKLSSELEGATRTDLNETFATLIAQADEWVVRLAEEGPWTVTKKSTCAPSENPHDYMSQAPYWWPSDTPDKLPYVLRDGEFNPNAIKTNKADVRKVFRSVHILSLAWFYSKKNIYGANASAILRAWFLDPKTRMNPNLRYAQCIPGVNTGRSIGIIDFSQSYTSVVDAVALLAYDCPSWTRGDHDQFIDWNRSFLDWLLHSDFGKEESQRLNNHGNFAILQKAAIAMFIGDTTVAMREAGEMQRRLPLVIQPDGSQPLELCRTRSWHYSCYNLVAFTRMAEISKHLGVDLWQYQGPDGESLQKSIEYLIPAATGNAKWHESESNFLRYLASDIIRACAKASNRIPEDAIRELQAPPSGDLWLLRRVPENLDAFGS